MINHVLYEILNKLDESRVHYRLDKQRPRAIMICIAVPGERIEMEVFDNGDIETSRFVGDESVSMEKNEIDIILQRYAD